MTFSVETPETIGDRLRRLRIARGQSQRSLAIKGVSYAYISRIEAGTRTPSVKALRVLARRLGVSVEYLETGQDLGASEVRELKLRDAELQLRLADETTEAELLLEELVGEAEAAGDLAVAVRARSALGMTVFRRGDHAAAIAALESALAYGTLSVVEGGDIYRTLGRAYAASGRVGEAVRLFESCLEELTRVAPQDDVAYVHFAVYLSYALSDLGELARARELVALALRRGTRIPDPTTRARLYWSNARLALTEQKPRVALENLRRAVTLLEATDDARELARAHLFWAHILTLDSRPGDAQEHLALAGNLLGGFPDHDDLCMLRGEQARAAAELGQAAEAVRSAREALALGDGDAVQRAAALWALGHGLADLGELDDGIALLKEAIAVFEGAHAWLDAGSAAHRLGLVLRDAGREQEALDAFERAAGFTTRAESGSRASARVG